MILKLFVSLINPVYNIPLHIRPQFKFSLVHHLWGITSKFFLFSLMTVHLFVFHGILLNLVTTHNLVLDSGVYSASVYLGTVAIILTISTLPHPLLLGSFVATAITMGETLMLNVVPSNVQNHHWLAHQDHAVMLREAFLRQHHPLLHVHNATIWSVLPVTMITLQET